MLPGLKGFMPSKESNGSSTIEAGDAHNASWPRGSNEASAMQHVAVELPPGTKAVSNGKEGHHAHDAHDAPGAPAPRCLDPSAVVRKLVDLGDHKAKLPFWNTYVQGVMAGVYLSFGGLLMYTVGLSPALQQANLGVYKLLLGSFGLPFGLLAIVITGASLFTSNTMYLPIAWYHGRATLQGWLLNWFLSYVGNLSGSLLIAGMAYGGGVFHGVETQLYGLPYAKVHHTWGENVVRAILANWFVNLAIFQTTAASDLASKFIAIYLPISAFATIGLEHSIASMYLIPQAMMYGADISVSTFVGHYMVPVTIGNIIAGWLVMATVYTLLYSDFSALRRKQA